MIRLIQRRLIIPRGDTGTFTVPALSPGQSDSVGVFTIFDPITKTRVFQKQVELQDGVFNIEFDHGDTVNLQAGDYLWDIKFYVNPIIENGKVIDGTEIDSYYAAFQTPKCEIRETGDDFMVIDGQPAKIEDLNIILAATSAANAAKVAATEQAEIAAEKASEAAERLTQMIAAIPTKVSELENDSGYLQEETDPTVPAWAKTQTKPTYTPQEVGALPSDTFIPSKVSDLTDDSGHYIKPANGIPASDLEETYLTQHQDISMKANSADLAAVATSGDYSDLANTPYIPTKTSDLVNDSSYPVDASYVHTDNNYTTAEKEKLAGIAAGAEVNVNADWNAASGDAQILNKPTNVSAFENDAGYLTEHQDISGKADKSEIPTQVSELENDAGYLTSFTETDPTVPAWAKAAQKPSYTAVEVGAPTVAEMNTAIGNAIGNINSFDMAVVQTLPTQDISTHTIYLVPKTGETNDVYDEYVYINDAWEMVGNTQVDLSNYVQKTDYASTNTAGVVKIGAENLGLVMSNDGTLAILTAPSNIIKAGSTSLRPIPPQRQHESAFYGLAKAAGDTTQSQSDNAVGTYTTEAKAAIRSMIGAAASADISVQDVQINGTSVVENGVANVPVASTTTFGVAKYDVQNGVEVYEGKYRIVNASESMIKAGGEKFRPITPSRQHNAVFYGLAKAAGDTTQSQSNNTVGTYTETAKGAIQKMLGISDLIAPEENDLVANQAYAIGDMFTSGGKLYKATSAIISGGTIIPTTNCVEITVIDALATKLDAAAAVALIHKTLTVMVLTQDNVTVTGQTVTVRADDANGEVYATAAYEGQPVSFSVPDGFQYYISVSDTLAHHFNPTTASGIITNTDVSVTLQYSDFSTIRSARDIKAVLNAGLDLTDLVGGQITCTKNNETLTWDVADYDATNERVTLLLHDAFGTANMVFEPAQALMWCENGLAAGAYTFTWNTTQCYFTLATAIPAGGQLRATNFQFQTYASQDTTVALETGTVSTEEITGATDLGQTGQGLLNHHDRVNYGSNNQAESAIQWWLNSDAPANTLRTPVTKFSRAFSYSVPGFMNGLDSDFLDCLDIVDWLCSTNNVYECPETLGGLTKGTRQTYTIKSKFCFASEMEIFGSYGGNADGSTVFDLYNGADADDRKKYRGTSAQIWWFRSPRWGNADTERFVSSSGLATGGVAFNSYAVVPACQISRDTEEEAEE